MRWVGALGRGALGPGGFWGFPGRAPVRPSFLWALRGVPGGSGVPLGPSGCPWVLPVFLGLSRSPLPFARRSCGLSGVLLGPSKCSWALPGVFGLIRWFPGLSRLLPCALRSRVALPGCPGALPSAPELSRVALGSSDGSRSPPGRFHGPCVLVRSCGSSGAAAPVRVAGRNDSARFPGRADSAGLPERADSARRPKQAVFARASAGPLACALRGRRFPSVFQGGPFPGVYRGGPFFRATSGRSARERPRGHISLAPHGPFRFRASSANALSCVFQRRVVSARCQGAVFARPSAGLLPRAFRDSSVTERLLEQAVSTRPPGRPVFDASCDRSAPARLSGAAFLAGRPGRSRAARLRPDLPAPSRPKPVLLPVRSFPRPSGSRSDRSLLPPGR